MEAICDTSVLIKLNKGEVLDCLGSLFHRVYLPQGVKEECVDDRLVDAINKPFFRVRPVQNIIQSIGLGRGEREAISLAVEFGLKNILTDDIKAFRKAIRFDLLPLTSENILILAKAANLIESVGSVMNKMRDAGEGIHDEVYFQTLKMAGESVG